MFLYCGVYHEREVGGKQPLKREKKTKSKVS
jgi:hypothetical protein